MCAKENAKHNNLDVKFFEKDIFKTINFDNKFSILVSNPPYVALDEYVTPNTKYEPSMALYPGEDDISFYKRILDLSKDLLYEKNIIAFEIGCTQAERICKYAKNIYPNANISVEKDYTDRERFIFIFNNFE
jgi:release factor glutamine methyltransferase